MPRARFTLALTLPGLCLLACKVYTDDLLVAGSAGSAAANGGPSGGMSGTLNGGSTSGSTNGGKGGQTSGNGGGGGSPAVGGGGHGGVASGGGGSGATGGTNEGEAGSGAEGGEGSSSGRAGSDGGEGGSAGSDGGEIEPRCGDHPLTARASWIPSASHDNSGTSPASNLIDNATTRWTTGKAQSSGEWLQIDFTTTVNLTQINLQQSETYGNDYPRTYNVIVSDTANDTDGTVIASGSGQAGVSTVITLPALATGQYLLLKQLGSSLSWWSAVEIEVSCVD
jgi:hypothetical protein